MKSSQFAAKYEHSTRHVLEFSDPRLSRINRRLGVVTSMYETLLDSILRQSLEAPEQEAQARSILTQWVQNSFLDDIQYTATTYEEQLVNADVPHKAEPVGHLFQSLQFVSLSYDMAYLWHQAATEQPFDRTSVRDTQTRLAIRGISFAATMDAIEKKGELFVANDNPEDKRSHMLNPVHTALGGMINEVDGGIALLEIPIQRPEVAILPAPGKYEHGRKSALNSDFIAVNIFDDTAIGLQIKSHVTSDNYARYDPSTVVVIDAGVDLGNARTVLQPHSRRHVEISWPGLVSAHHMQNIPDPVRNRPGRKGVAFRPTQQDAVLLRARQRSRAITRQYPRYNSDEVTRRLSERIHPKLLKVS